MQINFKLRKICKWLCTFIKGKSALMAIWQKRTERTFDSVPPLNILHLVEHHVRPFFKNHAPLHSSYWHIWFFLRLTLINSCCQLQARSSQPEQKVSAFLSFFLSFFHWRLVSHQCMLLVPLFADFLIFPIELFLFSTAVKGYVYIWIYISILASTFMSTDTFSIFPMEPISIH